jgi:hypothetical protein
VTASTFLSGPVAGLTTFGILMCGFFIGFLRELATGKLEGGGPLESLYRIVTGENAIEMLEQTTSMRLVQSIDVFFSKVLWALTFIVPDLSGYNTAGFVASGFNIPAEILGPNTLRTFGYVVPTLILGYLFLKVREIAK